MFVLLLTKQVRISSVALLKKMELVLNNLQRPGSVYDFARLSAERQMESLRISGVLLDTDFENDKFIHLYFLNGFFVEVTVFPEKDSTHEIIPFRQGYRVGSYFFEKKVLVPKKQNVFEGNAKMVCALVPCLN
jgi:hypothetical protein